MLVSNALERFTLPTPGGRPGERGPTTLSIQFNCPRDPERYHGDARIRNMNGANAAPAASSSGDEDARPRCDELMGKGWALFTEEELVS